MRTAIQLMLCVVLATVIGCSKGQDIARPDAAWTLYESKNQALRFEMPDGLKKKVRSVDPAAVLYENQTGDFSISVMHGTDFPAGDEFVKEMIAVSLEGSRQLGDATPVAVGTAKGLQQDHKTLVGYKHHIGRTIAMTSGNDRIVIDVMYAERFEEELQPIYERVLDSLEFENRASTVTRNVSTNAANKRFQINDAGAAPVQ